MQLQFLGHAYAASTKAIATTQSPRCGLYRGQASHLSVEATEQPNAIRFMTYRGASYLGR